MSRTLLALAFAFVAVAAPAPKPAELDLTDVAGKPVHLRDYRGKLVVVNFWATWCGPCKAEMPMIVAAEKKWKAQGVVFIAASLDDERDQKGIPAFVTANKIAFPVWTGVKDADVERLDLGEAIPATLFIDKTGVIYSRVKGEMKSAQLEQRLGWAVGPRTGPAPR